VDEVLLELWEHVNLLEEAIKELDAGLSAVEDSLGVVREEIMV
jgi:hypothetical protein